MARPRITPQTLTPRMRMFVLEYLIDLHPTNAAKRMKLNYPAERASIYMKHPAVIAEIEKEMEQRARRLRITADMVAEELGKLAFANMADYSTVDGNGDRVPSLADCTRDQLAAVTELKVEQYVEGKGDDARTVKKTQFKLGAKREALVDLGRHLGMFKDRLEVSGPNGGPVPHVAVEMTPKEAAEAYARSLIEGPPALVIEHDPRDTAPIDAASDDEA